MKADSQAERQDDGMAEWIDSEESYSLRDIFVFSNFKEVSREISRAVDGPEELKKGVICGAVERYGELREENKEVARRFYRAVPYVLGSVDIGEEGPGAYAKKMDRLLELARTGIEVDNYRKLVKTGKIGWV